MVVLIPTYNRAEYLRTTIESVLAQSYPHVRIKVFDDASTDSTAEVAQSYAAHPRISWIRYSENRGMVENWRIALESVDADYFCLLNDDDTLEPQCIETLLAPMVADSGLILSFCDHWIVDEEGNRLIEQSDLCSATYGRTRLPEGNVEDFCSAAIFDRSLHISCTLVRAGILPDGVMDRRSGGFACAWLFYQCYRTGKRAYYVSRRLVNYRVHPGNMSGNEKWDSFLYDGQIFACREMLADPKLLPVKRRLHRQTARIFSNYATRLLALGEYGRSRRLYMDSLSLTPNPKALAGIFLTWTGLVGREIVSWLSKHLSAGVRNGRYY